MSPAETAPPHWQHVAHNDPRGRALADRHYSRQTPGARDFTPPGRKMVLLTADATAVFAAVENCDPTGARQWRCSIFRNEGATRSSDLVREATAMVYAYWRTHYGYVPGRLVTEVRVDAVRPKRDPGRCFRRAGWIDVPYRRRGMIRLAAPEVTP